MADYDKIICIDEWKPDDSAYEKGYYPEGSREKAVYFSPDTVGDLPLKPHWRYLFKKSRNRTPWQFWMEIIAYRIGQVMGVPVPPAFVGLSNQEKPGQPVYGALIEWFYSKEDQYVEGARLIGPLIPEFDYKTGQQHNLQTILSIPTFTEVPDSENNRLLMVEHWAKILTFDTVIGNTDRHTENWGIVFPPESDEAIVTVSASPAFDNGTALSYEQPEDHFSRFANERYACRYLTKPSKARHHMRWCMDETADLNFFDFMRRFVLEFPQTRDGIMGMLQFSEDDLRARLAGLTAIPTSPEFRLTERRLDFTLKLVMMRVELLKNALAET